MARLLYIQASPRGGRSYSTAAADAFVAAYKIGHPGDTVETLNVFHADLPVFDGAALEAKYAIMHGQEHTSQQRLAWSSVEAVIAQFKRADKYLVAVPMWNFGIPYRLKQYIDVLVQPGYTFGIDANGYKGLVTGRPATVVYARGGEYPPGTPGEAYDLQKRYMELILGFIGFTDIRTIVVGPTLEGTREDQERVRVAGIELARAAGRDF